MPEEPLPARQERQITITHHGRNRGANRQIGEDEIKIAIRNGRKVNQNERGKKGGEVWKFYYTLTKQLSGKSVTKRIVVVCECFPDRDVVLSTYIEPMRT